MGHLLWVTYCGKGDMDRRAGANYPVLGITDTGGLWVLGERRTVVAVSREDYEVYSIVYDEPRTASPETIIGARGNRRRGKKGGE